MYAINCLKGDNMRFLYIAVLLLFAGCGTMVDDVIFTWDIEDENPFHGQTLTVGVPGMVPWRTIAATYMQQYPGVNIEIMELGGNVDEVRQ